jgi:hypothetical protein
MSPNQWAAVTPPTISKSLPVVSTALKRPECNPRHNAGRRTALSSQSHFSADVSSFDQPYRGPGAYPSLGWHQRQKPEFCPGKSRRAHQRDAQICSADADLHNAISANASAGELTQTPISCTSDLSGRTPARGGERRVLQRRNFKYRRLDHSRRKGRTHNAF